MRTLFVNFHSPIKVNILRRNVWNNTLCSYNSYEINYNKYLTYETCKKREDIEENIGISNKFRMSSSTIIMGVSWLTMILSTCLMTIVVLLLVRRGKFLYALRKVPCPPAFPIIGNAYELCCSPEGKWNIF